MKFSLVKLFNRQSSSARIILAFFLTLILIGTFLLMLPFSSVTGEVDFIDALFTSTSAVCVTGLIVQNTASFWTPFGKAVIILLIQIGGLGILTSVLFMVAFLGRKDNSIMQRSILKDAISAPQIGGIYKLSGFILGTTFAVEAIGAVLMMPVFLPRYGEVGVLYSFFHSISAFCNAGFDILPDTQPFSSIVTFQSVPLINIVLMLLIIIGGIGFLTWDDIAVHHFRFQKYRLQTKLVLVFTFFMILIPFLLFFFFEFAGMPLKERILVSLFQAVTPRTAGFATIDYQGMSETGRFLTIMLMLVGGSSGSTAGGIKITTFAVAAIATVAVLRRREDATAFNRRIEKYIVLNAYALFAVYITLFLFGSFFISGYEGVPLVDAMFETASAIATVGLTTGITPGLSSPSKVILICFMYLGRVGGMTLAYAASSVNVIPLSKQATEKVNVG
ncbi:MAG: Trk family potassium uptake protein [Erysipelotrichaceae bacterium]|nr:Trk family potassium uptake protein [Erysipelotrichaceae bacterium]MBR4122742.1 Trk family potassium uptake protein [Erysipelotrichaceae bacterium]